LTGTLAFLAVLAFLISLAIVRLIERHASRLGLLDLPNTRSSHAEPRPRGGGIGIVLGTTLAAIAAVAAGTEVGAPWIVVLGAALLVSLAGLWDDRRGLGVRTRLIVQVVAAVIVVATRVGLDRLPLPAPADIPLGVLGSVFAVVWMVGVTNFFNFMDGVDGLAAGQAVISLGAIGWILWPASAAIPAILAAAASAAFLTRNWFPARIFLGDIGSAFLGFLLAALPFARPVAERPGLILFVAVSLALFLLDPVATLIVRAMRGAKLGAAHREHAYQRLIPPGHPHGGAVGRLLGAGLFLSILAAASYERGLFGWLSVVAAFILFGIEWTMASRSVQPKS
jgi:glycosyltransferase WbpL